jgi:hypothetical protein
MNQVQKDRLTRQVSDFLTRHKAAIYEISRHNTHLFEAVCFVIFARYYEEIGYQLRPENLLEGKFRFRWTTNGYPWNYSYFAVLSPKLENEESSTLFEIHHNQKVTGAWVEVEKQDEGEIPPMFAVDIAVAEAGSLPKLPQGHKHTDETYWIENSRLLTFAEAKKLTAYPMLLAQFLGIVHEIKLEFLHVGKRELSQAFWEQKHLPPTLLTADHLTSGTRQVLKSFHKRELMIRIVENVIALSEEMLLRQLRGLDEGLSRESVAEELQETEALEHVPF